jgi:G:T/U-mismatch repair DNA glycosylase
LAGALKGSLDGSIRGATPNLLRDYAETHRQLAAIAFNGQTAARLGRAALDALPDVQLVDLPSSSPAYTLAFAEKAKRWSVLGTLACGPEAATLAP